MLQNIIHKNSPNFNERADGVQPSMIILHYTGMQSAQMALDRLCDPDAQVSAHYVVEENGQIHQLVANDKRAWHAGVSYWNGITDINAHSIGIEIVNPGHEFGYRPFPEVQIEVVSKLSQGLMSEFSIHPKNVLAHSDVSPGRKQDPGELFPWEALARDGVGLWPAPEEMDYDAAVDILNDEDAFANLLDAIGYNVSKNYTETVIAFHRHFRPELFKPDHDPAQVDELSIAKFLSLLRLSRNA